MPETSRGTLALATLDCATKLRVHYLLPTPLDVTTAESIWPGQVRLQRFSQLSAKAKDLLEVRSDQLHASGAVGGLRLVVTFGKLGGACAPERRNEVESAMESAGLGPVRQALSEGCAPAAL